MKSAFRRVFYACRNQSIGARLAFFSLVLLFVIQVASVGAIHASLAAHARAGLPAALQVGERVLQTLLEQKTQRLTQGARLLAADYGFRSAVLSNDAETIASVLANHGKRIGATETAFLGPDFALRASSGQDVEQVAAFIARLAPQAAASGAASEIALLGGRPHQLVLIPMKAPVLVGWVLTGFPLDSRLAAEMKSLSALNLTLLTRSNAREPWAAALTSLPEAQARALADKAWPSAAAGLPLQEVRVDREQIGVLSFQLGAAATAGLGADDRAAVLALISLSIDAAVKPPRDLQIGLLVITLIGFAVFVVGSFMTARRVTTPLRELGAAAERLRAGDYTAPFEGTRARDEIGHLARALESMRISVCDKQQEILKLAYWDSLTGLPNRVQFRDAVRDAIVAAAGRPGEAAGAGVAGARVPGAGVAGAGVAGAGGVGRAAGGTVAVLMLNLDRFKHVNDVLGYRFGDLLLKRVAECLSRERVRGNDLVARLGGDEFAVLLRAGDANLVRAIAGRIGDAFNEPMTLEEHTVDMGAGIGMACWPEHGSDVDLLLSRAEIAMYTAKRKADGPVMYEASIDAASAQSLSLLTELRHAIDRGELRLYLQPKLAVESGRVVGAETLVRWAHPTRGLVPPMEFIPFAEQTGFIRTLTIWVFEEAARHWLMLQAQGLPMTLSVNLSTRDLLDQDLPQKFDALLVKHRVPAEAFCLEITESAIMDDPQRSLGTLNRLSALGFRLSIDDFGTGYSSLAYLKRLPVDELKIDKSFVMSMESDHDDAKIVRSTIDLAHNLGLKVVAEGVENAQVWDLLRELDCDEAQGYHMGKPMPAADFNGWSTAWVAKGRPQTGPGASASAMLH